MAGELEDIGIFHEVARTGSITAAAAELAVPKSTVSRRMIRLEERLGAKLFHKSTRRIVLTDLGQAYFERCQAVARELRETRAFMDHVTANPAGVLRVTTTAEIAVYWLVDFLVAFAEANPEVTLALDFTGRRVDLIGEGYDIAIRIGHLESSDLVARRFITIDRALYASPHYVARYGAPKSVAELAQHRFVLLAAHAHPPEITLIKGDIKETVATPGTIISNSLGVVRGLTLAGGGIAAMPVRMCAQDIAESRLVRLVPDWAAEATSVSYIVSARKLLPAKTRLFVEALTGFFERRKSRAGTPLQTISPTDLSAGPAKNGRKLAANQGPATSREIR